jgi:hypothetical protein
MRAETVIAGIGSPRRAVARAIPAMAQAGIK